MNQNSHQFDQNCWSNYSWNYFVLLNSCKSLKKYKICKCSVFRSANEKKVFWKFHFIICRIFLNLDTVLESICLNSDCTMIIDNRDWIKKHCSDLKIHQIKNLIMIRKIETIRYFMNEFVILNIYISKLINDKIEMIEIIAEVHLICNLKIKFLIDINILDSEKMNISFCNHFLIINSKDKWKARIHVHTKNNICVCQKIQAFKKQIISSYFFLTISIEFKSALFTDWDFLFASIYSDAHTYLINVNMHFIHVWNHSDWSIHISLKNSLEKIVEIKEKQCYYVNNNLHDLAVWKSAKDSESNMLKSNKIIIVWQNSEILFNIINKNVDISFEIQIH